MKESKYIYKVDSQFTKDKGFLRFLVEQPAEHFWQVKKCKDSLDWINSLRNKWLGKTVLEEAESDFFIYFSLYLLCQKSFINTEKLIKDLLADKTQEDHGKLLPLRRKMLGNSSFWKMFAERLPDVEILQNNSLEVFYDIKIQVFFDLVEKNIYGIINGDSFWSACFIDFMENLYLFFFGTELNSDWAPLKFKISEGIEKQQDFYNYLEKYYFQFQQAYPSIKINNPSLKLFSKELRIIKKGLIEKTVHRTVGFFFNDDLEKLFDLSSFHGEILLRNCLRGLLQGSYEEPTKASPFFLQKNILSRSVKMKDHKNFFKFAYEINFSKTALEYYTPKQYPEGQIQYNFIYFPPELHFLGEGAFMIGKLDNMLLYSPAWYSDEFVKPLIESCLEHSKKCPTIYPEQSTVIFGYNNTELKDNGVSDNFYENYFSPTYFDSVYFRPMEIAMLPSDFLITSYAGLRNLPFQQFNFLKKLSNFSSLWQRGKTQ